MVIDKNLQNLEDKMEIKKTNITKEEKKDEDNKIINKEIKLVKYEEKSENNNIIENNDNINIEQKVENSLDVVVKANDQELEKAAKIAISRRRLAYQFGLSTALGAIGSAVPGIGNAIGIALGNLIGYGIYKIDNHRLNKAKKKQEKVKNERKNK